MDEHEAIEHMRKGDIQGLESLVRLHQVRALRAAYLITREQALAQDVVPGREGTVRVKLVDALESAQECRLGKVALKTC